MRMKSTHSGIGFIEVMTATVIISIACIGLLMGVVHARGELHSLETVSYTHLTLPTKA